ncbi:hypothetical protein M5K25_027013 [Dendrobium thyrsiflorum]|uniref:Uncharacterized protein n=1 Tax=Dendrobium thyrsiflorum TaxID=117978 RepID=A0ABD0TYW7_DENTH
MPIPVKGLLDGPLQREDLRHCSSVRFGVFDPNDSSPKNHRNPFIEVQIGYLVEPVGNLVVIVRASRSVTVDFAGCKENYIYYLNACYGD